MLYLNRIFELVICGYVREGRELYRSGGTCH